VRRKLPRVRHLVEDQPAPQVRPRQIGAATPLLDIRLDQVKAFPADRLRTHQLWVVLAEDPTPDESEHERHVSIDPRPAHRERLAALFRGSEVGLVTPLRDGMNLVAKEYIAAQDENDPGVLVLSRFAGAAEDLEEALIVNPYDIDDIAHALEQALTMPLDERRSRHKALFKRVCERDATNWRNSFMAALIPHDQGAFA